MSCDHCGGLLSSQMCMAYLSRKDYIRDLTHSALLAKKIKKFDSFIAAPPPSTAFLEDKCVHTVHRRHSSKRKYVQDVSRIPCRFI